MGNVTIRPPEEFFIAPKSQERYTGNRLIPILDDGNFDRVLFLDPAAQKLVLMYVEFPEESRKAFANWQEYLEDLMSVIFEHVDGDETQLRRAAELIGYEQIDTLLARFALE